MLDVMTVSPCSGPASIEYVHLTLQSHHVTKWRGLMLHAVYNKNMFTSNHMSLTTTRAADRQNQHEHSVQGTWCVRGRSSGRRPSCRLAEN